MENHIGALPVDLEDEDGNLLQGGVIDISNDENSFLVNFDCTDLPDRWMPANKVFQCIEKLSFSLEEDLFMLLRARRTGPKQWFPAKFVAQVPPYTVMDATLPDGMIVREVINEDEETWSDQMSRLRNFGNRELAKFTRFITPLPFRLWCYENDSRFHCVWRNLYCGRILRIQNHIMEWIVISNRSHYATVVHRVFSQDGKSGKETSNIIALIRNRESQKEKQLTLEKRKMEVLKSTVTNCCLKDVPNELLVQVFSWIDVAERFRFKRVCRRWNYVISSKELSRFIRISLVNKGCHNAIKWFCKLLDTINDFQTIYLEDDFVDFDLSRVRGRIDSTRMCLVNFLSQVYPNKNKIVLCYGRVDFVHLLILLPLVRRLSLQNVELYYDESELPNTVLKQEIMLFVPKMDLIFSDDIINRYELLWCEIENLENTLTSEEKNQLGKVISKYIKKVNNGENPYSFNSGDESREFVMSRLLQNSSSEQTSVLLRQLLS